jgi:hypothetical protein
VDAVSQYGWISSKKYPPGVIQPIHHIPKSILEEASCHRVKFYPLHTLGSIKGAIAIGYGVWTSSQKDEAYYILTGLNEETRQISALSNLKPNEICSLSYDDFIYMGPSWTIGRPTTDPLRSLPLVVTPSPTTARRVDHTYSWLWVIVLLSLTIAIIFLLLLVRHKRRNQLIHPPLGIGVET